MMTNPVLPWETTQTNETINEVHEVQQNETFKFPWDSDTVTSLSEPATPMVTETAVTDTSEPETVPEITENEVITDNNIVTNEETVTEPIVEEKEEPTEPTETEPTEPIEPIVDVSDRKKATEALSENARGVLCMPAGDCNFTSCIEKCSIEELEEALKFMQTYPEGNKTRIARVEIKLAKMKKSSDDTKVSDTDIKDDKEAEKVEKENAPEVEAETETETDKEDEIPKEPIFKEDEFAKINQQDIADKDKAILYMINHYHISPNLLNSLIEGNFENAWADISSMNKENMTVKAKLEKELKGADDSRLKIAEYLLDKATKEPEFAIQILLEHKEFERCYKYITDKVRETYTGKNSQCVQVDDDKVYQWAVDYYNLDDFEQIMAERKAEEERKKKAAERKAKKTTTKKTTTKKTTKKVDAKEESKEVKTPESVVPTPPAVETETDSNSDKSDKKGLDPETPIDVEETAKITEEEAKVIEEVTKEKEEEKKEEDKLNESIAIADSYGQFKFTF